MAKSATKEEPINKNGLTSKKDPELGEYFRLLSAKTGINGQDGGVATSLLLKGLKEDQFEEVIAVKNIKGYNAKVVASKNPEEIIETKGTKYLKVNVSSKLHELIKQGKRKIAVVCTPCEAKAVRKLEAELKKKYSELEITIIGLFCLEAFRELDLRNQVRNRFNVNIDDTDKIEVRKGKFIVRFNEKEFNCKISELAGAVEKSCLICSDFSSNYADISVGSAGSQMGYSTVIVRSDKGKKIFDNLEAIITEVKEEEVMKLARFKRERAEKNLTALKKQR